MSGPERHPPGNPPPPGTAGRGGGSDDSGNPPAPPPEQDPARIRIYLVPNLFTAANLFCGFLALTRIVEADPGAANFGKVIYQALFYILLACIFDLIDGRVARMGGYESPFGREFDSLADIVSFGVAPAFLVHRVVLKPVFINHPEVGWFIASLYVICGAFRLARFNCIAAASDTGGGRYFLGFPIPAAAGMVASLTLFMLAWDERELRYGTWRYALPVLMVFLSAMMVSEVRYPTFKRINWRTRHPFIKTVVIIVVIAFFVLLWRKVLPWVAPIIFAAYLLYGFIRPLISPRMQREIEAPGGDDDDDDGDREEPDNTRSGRTGGAASGPDRSRSGS